MATHLITGVVGTVPITALTKAKLKPYVPESLLASSHVTMFSAQVAIHYNSNGDLIGFTVSFSHNSNFVYVRDEDLLGLTTDIEESAFRFFDWKNPLWEQITGTIARKNCLQIGTNQYIQSFTFHVAEDVFGIDYFGLRLKKGMFGFQCQDSEIDVIYQGIEQRMIFDTPYFILNPKNPAQDLIQIRQDCWMPLLVSAYALGSAVERRGRPYFSQAIERIKEWFMFMLGCKRNENDANVWNEIKEQHQLIREMLRELWEKGPRRLVAFYSGMGYVFHALNLADMAADVIYDFYSELNNEEGIGVAKNFNYTSPRLFAIMLLLGLRTEKARLYVTVDLNESLLQESYTQRGIRELLEAKTLTNLFFSPHGKDYAPISIPKSFELQWGQLESQLDHPHISQIIVEYKHEIKLLLSFNFKPQDQRYSISLTQLIAQNNSEWLGQIVIKCRPELQQIHFVSESITSNFRYLRNVNAFKYVLLVAALQYVIGVLSYSPMQILFAADFFDHCAPYDLLLLQQLGWQPVNCDLALYNLNAIEIVPYSGRAMTLPMVRIPAKQQRQPSLVIYALGPDQASVVINEDLYREFIAHIKQQDTLVCQAKTGHNLLIDGLPRQLKDELQFQKIFSSINNFILSIKSKYAV